MENSIKKINDEMQKKPDDLYTEIIGHYVIDRCQSEADAELVAKEDKTLSGAMKAITDAASKKKQGSVAVMTDAEVFGVVDKYFDFKTDLKAQAAAMSGTGAAPVEAPVGKLDLTDFL